MSATATSITLKRAFSSLRANSSAAYLLPTVFALSSRCCIFTQRSQFSTTTATAATTTTITTSTSAAVPIEQEAEAAAAFRQDDAAASVWADQTPDLPSIPPPQTNLLQTGFSNLGLRDSILQS